MVGLGLLGFLLLSTSVISAQKVDAAGGKAIYANAILGHTPNGSSDLQWNAVTKELTVTIKLSGLAPDSKHPAHIHAGDCTSNGAVLYPLHDVVADAAGNAVSVTVISKIFNGIPDKAWYINVHNGPGLDTDAQFLPITCGNINNPHKSNSVHSFLGSVITANQAAYGSIRLILEKETLTVIASIHGLVPGSTHAAHIHQGSCESQLPGTIIYALQNVKGDKHGNASMTSVIQHVHSIPAHGWYINIHRGVTLTTQTGFDPILCGNVALV
jgi:hypothetical protein